MLYKELLENIKLFSGQYKKDLLTAASSPLRRAVNFNPNHLGANQLLADVLLAQGQAAEAREILEKLYQSQPAAARPRLIKSLLALANACDDETEQLKLYKQVFELDAEQLEAKSAWQKIWQQRGDEAYKAGQLETALTHYRTAQLEDQVAKLEEEIRHREIDTRLKVINKVAQANYKEALQQVQHLAEEYPRARDWDQIKQEILDDEIDTRLKVINDAKQTNRYEEALEQLRQLAKEFPEQRDWADDLEQLYPNDQFVESRQSLELKKDDKETSAVALEANSQNTNQYLHLSVKETDVINVIKTMHQYANELNESRLQMQALTRLLEEEKNARLNSEKTLTESHQLLEQEKNARANSEKELIESRKNIQELAGTIENEKNALAAAKEELTESRQKGEELKQHITQEKNALINAEKLAKEKDETANQYQQKIAQLKTELTFKEHALSQVENEFKNTVDKDSTELNEKKVQEQNVQEQVEAILARRDKKKQVNFLPIVGSFILALILIILGALSWQISFNNNEISKIPVQEIIVRSEPAKRNEPVIEKKPVPPIIPAQNLKTSQNLCVHFKKRSWLRVTDKSGEKILYEGIGKKGEILPLKGKPPFYMKVGNIGGVYVEYDCDVNQITAYPKRDGNKNLFIVGDE